MLFLEEDLQGEEIQNPENFGLKMVSTPDYENDFHREMQALNINRKDMKGSMLLYTEKAKQLSRNKKKFQMVVTGGSTGKKGIAFGREVQFDDFSFPNYKNRSAYIKEYTEWQSKMQTPLVDLFIGNQDNIYQAQDPTQETVVHNPEKVRILNRVEQMKRNMEEKQAGRRLEATFFEKTGNGFEDLPLRQRRRISIELRAFPVVMHDRNDNVKSVREGCVPYIHNGEETDQNAMVTYRRTNYLRALPSKNKHPLHGLAMKKKFNEAGGAGKDKKLKNKDSRGDHSASSSRLSCHLLTGWEEDRPYVLTGRSIYSDTDDLIKIE